MIVYLQDDWWLGGWEENRKDRTQQGRGEDGQEKVEKERGRGDEKRVEKIEEKSERRNTGRKGEDQVQEDRRGMKRLGPRVQGKSSLMSTCRCVRNIDAEVGLDR